MDKSEALKVVLDFVERWNKQDKEKDVAEAARVLQSHPLVIRQDTKKIQKMWKRVPDIKDIAIYKTHPMYATGWNDCVDEMNKADKQRLEVLENEG